MLVSLFEFDGRGFPSVNFDRRHCQSRTLILLQVRNLLFFSQTFVIFTILLFMLVPSFLVAKENSWVVEMNAPYTPAHSLSHLHMYRHKQIQCTSIAPVWHGYCTFTSSPGTQVDNLVYIFSGLWGVIHLYILSRGFRWEAFCWFLLSSTKIQGHSQFCKLLYCL